MNPKYLDRFKKYAEAKTGKLSGDNLVIELLPRAERKSSGGIIMADASDQRSQYQLLQTTIGIVLEIGEGYHDSSTGEDVPLERKVGEVVWVSEGNLRRCSTFPGLEEGIEKADIAVISESHIYKVWDSIEDYMKDQELLNSGQE